MLLHPFYFISMFPVILFFIYLMLMEYFKKVLFDQNFIYYHEFNKPIKKFSW